MAFHIIGDQDTVLGYRFAGVTGSTVESESEARNAFREAIASPRHRVLLITERVEDMLQEDVHQHRLSSSPPYVVVVQDVWGRHGGRKQLEDLIFEAVGIRIVRDKHTSSGS